MGSFRGRSYLEPAGADSLLLPDSFWALLTLVTPTANCYRNLACTLNTRGHKGNGSVIQLLIQVMFLRSEGTAVLQASSMVVLPAAFDVSASRLLQLPVNKLSDRFCVPKAGGL